MGQRNHTAQNALFIYVQDDSGRFWVYDDGRYHRFLDEESGFHYVRSQDYLPARVEGFCTTLSAAERSQLEAEASRCGIRVMFFDDPDDCLWHTLFTRQQQYIAGRTLPGGFFYLEEPRRR